MKSLTEILDHQKVKGLIRFCWNTKRYAEEIDKYADLLEHFRKFTPFYMN